MRAEFAAERDIALAHTTATMTRAKVIKPLEKYLPMRRRKKQRRVGSKLDQLRALAAATEHLG